MSPVLYIIVPCYNEQEVLPNTNIELHKKLISLIENKTISDNSRIVYVNDGSKDTTWNLIENMAERSEYVKGIKLTRNKGHQNALLCGISYAVDKCNISITIDADLQDDINAIDEMVSKYIFGKADIVYGVRSSRDSDTFFKRVTAEGYYKVLQFLGVDIVFNHADYRLMSRAAMEDLLEYNENNVFLRGMIPLIGRITATVEYERKPRLAGESKYPLSKMLMLAMDGVTSFSIKPIRFIFGTGCTIFSIGLVMCIIFLIRFIIGVPNSGWPSLIASVWTIGGLQLIATGTIGEYIGKTYIEVKHRPKFKIEKITEDFIR